jgi:hypothetical protein
MAGSRKLTVEILGDAKGVMGAFGKADKGAADLGQKFTDFGKKAAVGFAAAAAGIGYLAKGALDAAYESQKVSKQTEAIIKATGSAAGVTANQIGKLATSLSNKTGIDDEAIQTNLNLLLTFKKVRNEAGKGNDVFDRAAMAALDLGNVFGSTDAAAKQLGKALSNPVKGITALTKSGVDFTESQKAQIKSLVEQGKTLEAQKIILGEVEAQVGGTAAASATAMDLMSVGIGNAQEALGLLLLPAVETFATAMTTQVLPAVQSFTDSVEEKGFAQTFKNMGKGIAEATPGILASLQSFFNNALTWISGTGLPMLRNGLSKLGELFMTWIEPNIMPMISKLGDVLIALSTWIRDEVLPVVVDEFIKVGGALVTWVVDSVPELGRRLGEFAGKLGAYIEESLPIVLDKARLLGDALVEWVGEAVRKLPKEIIKLAAKLVEVILTDVIPAILKATPKILSALVSWTASLAVDLVAGLGIAFLELLKALPGLGKSLATGMFDVAKAAGKGLTNGLIELINGLINKVNDLLEFTIKVPAAPDIKINAPDIPNIPKLAEGGIVKNGPTLALIGEAGPEAVVPLSKGGDYGMGGDTNIYLTVQTGVGDPVAIGKSVVDVLQAYQRRAGALNLKVA